MWVGVKSGVCGCAVNVRVTAERLNCTGTHGTWFHVAPADPQCSEQPLLRAQKPRLGLLSAPRPVLETGCPDTTGSERGVHRWSWEPPCQGRQGPAREEEGRRCGRGAWGHVSPHPSFLGVFCSCWGTLSSWGIPSMLGRLRPGLDGWAPPGRGEGTSRGEGAHWL